MQRRLVALVACMFAALPAGCGQAHDSKQPSEHRIARFSGGSFAWSPDGERFAYTTEHRGHRDLFVVDSDGTDRRRLSHDAAGARTVRWSQDSRRIAYVSPHGDHLDLAVVGADGSGRQRVSHDASRDPRWSPEGERILFVSGHGLSVVDAGGSGERRLTHDAADYYDHSWSPDGQSIVFLRRAPRSGHGEPNPGVNLMNADGTALRVVTSASEFADAPAWSPDGERIAFVRTRFGPRRAVFAKSIAISDAGGRARRLTHGTGTSEDPAWSPDGDTIAYVAGPALSLRPQGASGCRYCGHDIAVINADGRGQRRLTATPAGSTSPVWSPDGYRIAFVRHADRGSSVFVMNADGSDQHRVTRNRDAQISVLWWPRDDLLAYAVVGAGSQPGLSFFLDIFVAPVD